MKNRVKKIAYVSGTRADYGLMTSILKAIDKSDKLELLLYATGIHLMSKFGETVKEVKKEFPQTKRIPAVFESDDHLGMAKFTGQFLTRLVSAFEKDKPDLVLTLGDRVEMLCVATACLYLGIPTAQVHGGEKTFTVDEAARHAITKLSQFHFPATKESAERIKKMGEETWRIHVVGAPALDTILNEKLPSRREVLDYLKLGKDQKFILVTQHPVSEKYQEAGKQMEETLAAVKTFGLPVVIIYPNADAGGLKIIKVLEREKNNPLFRIFPSIPYKMFLALEREAAVWVGNSSAGMIESSSFKTPVVNIGIRQLGRQHGENLLNVGYNRKEIAAVIKKSLFDKKYRKKLLRVTNPYGDGKTGPRVAKILENLNLDSKLLIKQITY